MAEHKPCAATTKQGKPCKGQALPGDSCCFIHSPAMADARKAACKKGGINSAKRQRLANLIPPRLMSVYDVLEEALTQVHEGELAPQRASAMSSVATAMVRVLTSGELEERVRKLEEVMQK